MNSTESLSFTELLTPSFMTYFRYIYSLNTFQYLNAFHRFCPGFIQQLAGTFHGSVLLTIDYPRIIPSFSGCVSSHLSGCIPAACLNFFLWGVRINRTRPVFPADLGKRQHKGYAYPSDLGGFVTVHVEMISAQFLGDIQEPKYNRRAVRGAESTVCHREPPRARELRYNDCKQLKICETLVSHQSVLRLNTRGRVTLLVGRSIITRTILVHCLILVFFCPP